LRWVSVVEKEDVPIDDISCMVIEFESMDNQVEQEIAAIPTIHSQFNVRDAFRCSFVEQKEM
jgi:hypothetical protein